MTNTICRTTMRECQTPGMCMPHGGCPDPRPPRLYLDRSTHRETEMAPTKMAIVPFDLLERIAGDSYQDSLRAVGELRELLATPGDTGMGVGDGSGRLFIHGDYESIKAMQAIVLERDAQRAQAAAKQQPLPTLAMCKAAEAAGVSFATQQKCFKAWFGGEVPDATPEVAAPKYPINHGTHIIQFADETFVWYDEAGLQGGVTYTLKAAEGALLRYVERMNRPAPPPDGRPAGCCCPPPGHTGIWGAGMCPVHQGLRRVQQMQRIGYCDVGNKCVCGGDTEGVRAQCDNWVRP